MHITNSTMTASELIDALLSLHPDTPVILENEDTTGTGYAITSVQKYDTYALICTCFETYTR